MDYFGNLKIKLNKLALKQIINSLSYIAFFLILVMVISNNVIDYYEVKKNLVIVTDLFSNLYEENINFIESQTVQEAFVNQDYYKFENYLNRFNSKLFITSNVVLLDENLNVVYSSYLDQRDTDRRLSYTKAIAKRMSQEKINKSQNAVYKNSHGFSDLMIAKRVDNKDRTKGYIVSFVSGYEWSYYILSNINLDSVITDLNDNVIFYNRPTLLVNKYQFDKHMFWSKINHRSYRILQHSDTKNGFNIYSLRESQDISNVISVILVSLFTGILWYKQSNKTANILIENNIKSVNTLISQIEKISDAQRGQRINVNSEDEYEYIAKHINLMLDRIDVLSKNNTDLLEFNNQIEMKQLLAQYNPHFLYNTLEVIRSNFAFDQKTANKLILNLTNILRYSINNPVDDVTLKEDMEYINNYLDIQKIRFGKRFNYKILIAEEAYNCTVPKLIIQPVIENSIKYGFENQTYVNLEITAKVVGDVLILRVIDDGPGMSKEQLERIIEIISSGDKETVGSSIGLYNTYRRLYLKDSHRNKMNIRNGATKGLEVILTISQN